MAIGFNVEKFWTVQKFPRWARLIVKRDHRIRSYWSVSKRDRSHLNVLPNRIDRDHPLTWQTPRAVKVQCDLSRSVTYSVVALVTSWHELIQLAARRYYVKLRFPRTVTILTCRDCIIMRSIWLVRNPSYFPNTAHNTSTPRIFCECLWVLASNKCFGSKEFSFHIWILALSKDLTSFSVSDQKSKLIMNTLVSLSFRYCEFSWMFSCIASVNSDYFWQISLPL